MIKLSREEFVQQLTINTPLLHEATQWVDDNMDLWRGISKMQCGSSWILLHYLEWLVSLICPQARYHCHYHLGVDGHQCQSQVCGGDVHENHQYYPPLLLLIPVMLIPCLFLTLFSFCFRFHFRFCLQFWCPFCFLYLSNNLFWWECQTWLLIDPLASMDICSSFEV